MRWIRLITALLRARFGTKLSVHDPALMDFRVWITDVDASIMNHAAMMTVMEAGRIDLMVRTGFFRLARKEKWYFPSAGISVQFIRPLKLFQKASLTTRVLHVTEHWIYLEQKISRRGRDIAACIVKSTVKKGRENISIPDVIRRLGHHNWPQDESELLARYEEEAALLRGRLSGSI